MGILDRILGREEAVEVDCGKAIGEAWAFNTKDGQPKFRVSLNKEMLNCCCGVDEKENYNLIMIKKRVKICGFSSQFMVFKDNNFKK